MMKLAILGALGQMHEWKIHCNGAIKNAVSAAEIRAAIDVVGIYCGAPQALECFCVATEVLTKRAQLPIDDFAKS